MTQYNNEFIRNFSIIAHIDHGKSTLSDRLLEVTGTVEKRQMQEQLLDDMELEKEKGITIKAHPVTMYYTAKDGKKYQMNFIDTPGHVDFSYEVSRSLSACEGALLIVDATQGVQAQTLANVHLAIDKDLEVLPVLNKVDLPSSDPEKAKHQIEEVIGLDASEAVLCSAKTGVGVEDILEQIVTKLPPPKEPSDDVLRALIFDSHYDTYRGVMVYLRVISGSLKRNDTITMMASGKDFMVQEVGIFSPNEKKVDVLKPGEVGYLVGNIKNTKDVKIGDTITLKNTPCKNPLPGFKNIMPVVFASIYPVEAQDFEALSEAIYKLQINDSALTIEPETSLVLGTGFRCGFLGLLHLEIIFERLQREYDLDVITTAPNVSYQVLKKDGSLLNIDSSIHFPDPSIIEMIEEPWVKCNIISPSEYLGAILNLSNEKRGHLINTQNLSHERLMLTFELPLNEIVTDFNDRLKSITQGYGSFDYEPLEYKKGDIIKLEIRVNEEPVDAFSVLTHRSKAESRGRQLCSKLKDVIPRQQFKIPVQAAIGGKIIARETISALAKNVTAKCYGGDISRKRKLWEKQKKGKKKMKEFGKVQIPQDAFIKILQTDQN